MSAILVVTALRPEMRAVLATLACPERRPSGRHVCWQGRAGGNDVTLVQAGVGPDAARRALAEVGEGYDLIVSFGLAGALAAELSPGDLILADAVLWEDGGIEQRYAPPPPLLAHAEDVLPEAIRRRARSGGLFSSPVVLAGCAAKRAAAARFGALAVEMETAALAVHARARGIPLLPLRVILDPADLSLEGLPPNVDVSWTARARLVVTPAVWPLLVTLRRHLAPAIATLAATAASVLPALAIPPRCERP